MMHTCVGVEGRWGEGGGWKGCLWVCLASVSWPVCMFVVVLIFLAPKS